MKPIKVLLADDHAIVRMGLASQRLLEKRIAKAKPKTVKPPCARSSS